VGSRQGSRPAVWAGSSFAGPFPPVDALTPRGKADLTADLEAVSGPTVPARDKKCQGGRSNRSASNGSAISFTSGNAKDQSLARAAEQELARQGEARQNTAKSPDSSRSSLQLTGSGSICSDRKGSGSRGSSLGGISQLKPGEEDDNKSRLPSATVTAPLQPEEPPEPAAEPPAQSKAWRNLRRKYGTAAAFESVLNQVRSNNTEELYEKQDWTKQRGTSPLATNGWNKVRRNLGGLVRDVRAARAENPGNKLATGQRGCGKGWQKLRRVLPVVTAFMRLLHEVREKQASRLYDRDWNKPKFGGSSRMMGTRVSSKSLGASQRLSGSSRLSPPRASRGSASEKLSPGRSDSIASQRGSRSASQQSSLSLNEGPPSAKKTRSTGSPPLGLSPPLASKNSKKSSRNGSVVLSSRQSSIVLSERPGPGSQALSVALSETRGPGSQALSVAVSESWEEADGSEPGTKVIYKHTHSNAKAHTHTHSHSHTHSHTDHHTVSRETRQRLPGGSLASLGNDEVEGEDAQGTAHTENVTKTTPVKGTSQRSRHTAPAIPSRLRGGVKAAVEKAEMNLKGAVAKERGHKRAAMPWGGVGVGVCPTALSWSKR